MCCEIKALCFLPVLCFKRDISHFWCLLKNIWETNSKPALSLCFFPVVFYLRWGSIQTQSKWRAAKQSRQSSAQTFPAHSAIKYGLKYLSALTITVPFSLVSCDMGICSSGRTLWHWHSAKTEQKGQNSPHSTQFTALVLLLGQGEWNTRTEEILTM